MLLVEAIESLDVKALSQLASEIVSFVRSQPDTKIKITEKPGQIKTSGGDTTFRRWVRRQDKSPTAKHKMSDIDRACSELCDVIWNTEESFTLSTDIIGAYGGDFTASCMTHRYKLRCMSWLEENDVQILLWRSSDAAHHFRALVWNTPEVGYFVDRLYPNGEYQKAALIRYVQRKKFAYRGSDRMDFRHYDGSRFRGSLTYDMMPPKYGMFPYLDTFQRGIFKNKRMRLIAGNSDFSSFSCTGYSGNLAENSRVLFCANCGNYEGDIYMTNHFLDGPLICSSCLYSGPFDFTQMTPEQILEFNSRPINELKENPKWQTS